MTRRNPKTGNGEPAEPEPYVKRWPSWTGDGVAALASGMSDDDAARLDDETQDRWAAEEAAERAGRAERQEQTRARAERQERELALRERDAEAVARKRELDEQEQRLRIANAARRLRERQARDS